MIVTIAVNFKDNKFWRFDIDFDLIAGALPTIQDFMMDTNPDATLSLHFQNPQTVVGPGLRQERSTFIDGNRGILLYRGEVKNINISMG